MVPRLPVVQQTRYCLPKFEGCPDKFWRTGARYFPGNLEFFPATLSLVQNPSVDRENFFPSTLLPSTVRHSPNQYSDASSDMPLPKKEQHQPKSNRKPPGQWKL